MKRTLAILFVAIMAMAGTASAYDAFIWNAAGTGAAPQPLVLKAGDSITLSFRAENIAPAAVGVPLVYDYTVVALAGGAQVSDITVNLPAAFTPTATTDTDIGAIEVTLDAAALYGAEYRVTIKAGDEQVDIDFGSASRNIESIPEFPTIALPIAAILGLAFFMQRRKEE
ncbi:hypothetical protein Mpsy_0751 [Methanolobus psychrophilus R15]|nr:hypothetical protein Mpsy_0751 [Methanolobus psychrophilus R15]